MSPLVRHAACLASLTCVCGLQRRNLVQARSPVHGPGRVQRMATVVVVELGG